MTRLTLISIFILVANFALNNQVDAQAKMSEVKTFNQLEKIVQRLDKKNHSKTLVVMDDDDTLTMMRCEYQGKPKDCQYLGGPAWYSWQENLLSTQSKYKVANSSTELLDIAALLLAMNDMDYTEKAIPEVLHKLTLSGVKLLVLTARGSSNLSATSSQFSKLFVGDSDKKQTFLDLINRNALTGDKSGIASIASPFQPSDCNAQRPVSYQQGIMYVAGQNKGEMLLCLLNRASSTEIRNIIFIDDTLKNVKDVYHSFKDKSEYDVDALHYTALQHHKEALTNGSKAETYQKNAQARWQAIRTTLKNELKKPAVNY
ncbi:DUF2608 domain-containing protein [Aliikangiella sp. G2MR2-5]|uniref:DUF2608 domain-containing protein n=1 Tax=Aliikangiella sp. G2MR2-5 TaxID=2788943 RepID=UPI0018AB9515|nr:DUF2608 domain-containing protein [Aliikangiella sp. G2MR2-5]